MPFPARSAFALLLAVGFLSCRDTPTSPLLSRLTAANGDRQHLVAVGTILISQLYGGGGNTGATYKNDFIELYNPSSQAVDITGWSVQYASAAGTSWAVTALSGTIQPGRYYLIQEAAGTNPGLPLPTPNATGTISMSATSGKVALAQNSIALMGTCPVGAGVDVISFGAGNCGNNSPAPSNTAAALRKNTGCAYAADPSLDFETGTPTPRSGSISSFTCPAPVTVTVTPTSASIVQNATQPFKAVASDAANKTTWTTFSWNVSDPNVASISTSGVATGLLGGDITVTATSANNVAGVAQLHVGATVVASVTVSPSSATVLLGDPQQFGATAFDDQSRSIAGVPFAWSSSAPAIVGIEAPGQARALQTGDATVSATTANSTVGTATLHVDQRTVVISQIYGGGGNSGATYKNDFIEIFNRGEQPVDLTGWTVQYASVAGASWNPTPLSGTLQPGHYYLVQEDAGSGGTVSLPTPDATGTISMGATGGKVVLARSGVTPSGACPSGAGIMDRVGYSTDHTDAGCESAWVGRTASTSNTSAAFRKTGGCASTGNVANDFEVKSPNPRNSGGMTRSCTPGVLDHVVITGTTSVSEESFTQLTATAQDGIDNPIATATFTWSSSDESIATVDANGKVAGVLASPNAVKISATAVDNGITKSASIEVTVTNQPINWVDLSVRATSFPPGFQTEMFVGPARVSQGGTVVPATFTFEAVDPEIATIAAVPNSTSSALVTGVAAPADGMTKPGFRVTATPVGGGTPYSFISHAILIETPASAPTSIYATNDEFGDPTPASSSNPNDFLIVRPQYTISYNQSRGTPNWVAYELDSRQTVSGQDRCNCFTADPLLPPDKQIFSSDYTNGGFDRGHMTRSADRTKANVDNAITYYLTNIVPQTPDLNQGVWAQFENMLGDFAKDGRAVYIVTGPLYSSSHPLTFVKNEGKVAIPDNTWKVALIGPRNDGAPFTRRSIQTWEDLSSLTVLAVNMPNIAGVRNDAWSKYQTTVDKIEEATGYDFLSLMPVAFQDALEAGDRAPAAHFSTIGTLDEGATITFDASTTTDLDLGRTDLGREEALTYVWHFSDGSEASGKVVTKTFVDNGPVTATLTVSDAFGWPNTLSQALAIASVAPTATFQAPATVDEGSSFALSLTDASDVSSADLAAGFKFAFDCGDGRGYSAETSTAATSCPTSQPATRTVRAKVIDKDGAFTEYTHTVSVKNVAPTVTLSATSPLSIQSGQTVSVSGSFVDPGNDGPWAYVLDLGYGTSNTGTFFNSGEATTGTQQYLLAGHYTITFSTTDKFAATGTQSLNVDVARRTIVAEVNPRSINLRGQGNGDITVRLTTTAAVDVAMLDVASVRLGTVGVTKKNNGSYQAELSGNTLTLHFERDALMGAGVLTSSTTELVLLADLTSGVQIAARGPVVVRSAAAE